jgi:dTDP-4-amino-4,6-dideoxygalactose transaminase
MKYNSWPLGKIPKELQRYELDKIKELGYLWNDPRDVVDMFENKLAKFTGSKYAVTVDCCSHAIFLSLKYLLYIGELYGNQTVMIPKHTYASIKMQINHAGLNVVFDDRKWSGAYQIVESRVWDAAVRWKKGMYIEDSLMCLSFQIKKKIPIGRGGAILTNDKHAYDWLKLVSYDGRDLNTAYTDEKHFKLKDGYHYYMTPEDAARGIILMDAVKDEGDTGSWENYTDISKI